MDIRLNTNIAAADTGLHASFVRRTPATDETSHPFAQTAQLDHALGATPTVRPEAVEKARQLAAQEHYPPEELVKKLGQLLTANIVGESK
jgi:hypothetical protein